MKKSAVWVVALALAMGNEVRAQAPVLGEVRAAAAQKMEFEVASVRQNKSGMPPAGEQPDANFPLGPGDVYTKTGGLFKATNLPLITYINFAYKVEGNQIAALLKQLPDWVTSDRFDIQARATGEPTKDEMRQMMQSLLAERFKLAIHRETREVPVYALALVKPGVTGPQLRVHPADEACSNTFPKAPDPTAAKAAPEPETVAGGFPTVCGGLLGMDSSHPGQWKLGARNVKFALLVNSLTGFADLGRPMVDQTGLTGLYDFTLEWTPEAHGQQQPGTAPALDDSGPTFREALKEQMGMKLESQKGAVAVLQVDHIEHPSAD